MVQINFGILQYCILLQGEKFNQKTTAVQIPCLYDIHPLFHRFESKIKLKLIFVSPKPMRAQGRQNS